MDQITVKTPNPKCRLHCCLIEFIDWRYSQSCWYFWPLLWSSAPLSFSLVDLPPPPPCVNSIYTVCNRGEGGWNQVVWRASTGVLHSVLDQTKPTKLFYHPNKNLGGEGGLRQINTCRQIPLQVNFKERRPLGFDVFIVIWSIVLGLRLKGNRISEYRYC